MSPATASGRVGRTLLCASSFSQVRLPSRISPKALHEDVAVGEHIGQLADLLRVGDRLIERIEKLWLHSTETLVLSLLRSL